MADREHADASAASLSEVRATLFQNIVNVYPNTDIERKYKVFKSIDDFIFE